MLRRYATLILFLTAAATGASANVILPISNFGCGLLAPPAFGSVVLQDCTSAGSAALLAAPANGLQGVGLGYAGSVTWNVAGSNNGGGETFPDCCGTEYQSNLLTLSTQGLTGGSGSTNIYLPLHYDFTISPNTFTCLTSNPCTTPTLFWLLSLRLSGPAVSNADGAFLNIATGTTTGEFTGDVTVPHGLNPNITVNPMTITAGEAVTVTATLTLNANGILPDEAGSFSILVPQGATFDFQSVNDVTTVAPEPTTFGLLVAALGLLSIAGRPSPARLEKALAQMSPTSVERQ
jgi:hypothetical protein